jgi:hypothetical protein
MSKDMTIAEINKMSKMDEVAREDTQGLIKKDLLLNSTLETKETPKVRELDVGDLVGVKYVAERVAELKLILKDEEIIRKYLASKGEKDPNPQKVGMLMKILDERMARKNG